VDSSTANKFVVAFGAFVTVACRAPAIPAPEHLIELANTGLQRSKLLGIEIECVEDSQNRLVATTSFRRHELMSEEEIRLLLLKYAWIETSEYNSADHIAYIERSADEGLLYQGAVIQRSNDEEVVVDVSAWIVLPELEAGCPEA
jgi:hypothetical protein